MQMPGLDEAKFIVEKWHKTLSKLQHKNINPLMLLPNMLLKTKSGAGKTTFCDYLSSYLDSYEIIDFYGDVKFFKFYFAYCSPEVPLKEITRFSEQLTTMAGYHDKYHGLIAIDLTKWVEHTKEAHFLMFLDYIATIDENCSIIFTADDMTDEQAKTMEKVLSSFCRIRSVNFPYPSKTIFVDYLADKLSDYNFILDDSGKILLEDSVERLMLSEYFDGYKTINRLYLDISFELMSQSDDENGNVSANDLQYFAKDSNFIKTLYSTPKIKSIGFDT